MSYKIGIIGLPNVGKSSLFSFWTKKNVLVANYPFATINPNRAIVSLPDSRLNSLFEYWNSAKKTPSYLELIDVAGLVEGASKGLGMGNEFLSAIREVDLILHVVRCFKDPDIVHVQNNVNPINDFKTIEMELIFSDLQQTENRISKRTKDIKEKNFLNKVKENLERSIPLREVVFSKEEETFLRSCNFLTKKPILVLANFNEKEETNDLFAFLLEKKFSFFPFFFSVFSEEKNDKDVFFIEQIVNEIKKQLKIKIFYTAGKEEVRSWMTSEQKDARFCAGLIHTDFAKNFVSLKVYNYEIWKEEMDVNALEKKGKIKKKGSEYIVLDGDICFFISGKNKR